MSVLHAPVDVGKVTLLLAPVGAQVEPKTLLLLQAVAGRPPHHAGLVEVGQPREGQSQVDALVV